MEDIGIPVYWMGVFQDPCFFSEFSVCTFSINVTNNPGKPGSLLVSHMQTEPKIFNAVVNIYEVSVPLFAKG